ncbi:MAG: ribosome small subunit-dependent GTPase A, partial [Anaerolineales bacterium]|nr:ribosome small subunit-dependent GTPase A [Anaerolineales bacterium]
ALLGKSGVGKTSVLNALQPGLSLPTQALGKSKKARGKHTTTHLEMFALDEHTWLLDTPGMRQFGLWKLEALDLAEGFPEMRPYLGRCKFGLDCRHDSEPGCAVRQAVLQGQIHPLRYRAYMRLLEDLR